MSLRTAPRIVASNALYRPPRCPSLALQQPRFPTPCAYSTTPPSSNRRAKTPNPNRFAPNDDRFKMRIRLGADQEHSPEEQLRAELVTRALDREAQLRGARVYRATKITEEHKKLEKMYREQVSDREALLRRPRVYRVDKTTEEHEKLEKMEKEQDYKRRYKQAERSWVKFIVAMPILIVTSYHLFQRLVMGKEQKVWPRAKPEQGTGGTEKTVGSSES